MKNLISIAALATALSATPALAHEDTPNMPAKTPAGAKQYVEQVESTLSEEGIKAARAEWIYANFITVDSERIYSDAAADYTQTLVDAAAGAADYARINGLDYDTSRKLNALRTGIVTPAPQRPGAAAEVSDLKANLEGIYGKGTGTLRGEVISGSDIEAQMGTVRDPELLKEMWTSWHNNVGTPMKDDYAKMVALMNEGSRELGFADTGAQWRSNYDMTPDEFAAETERLWQQVKPLYEKLHLYVRGKLNEEYGDAVQPDSGPIRADLLGNMWAQQWANIYDIVAPEGAGDIGYDLTELLVENGYDANRIAKTGENFFSSLGFEPLPETFWERSLFVKPADREVVCHASAWNLDNVDDLRVKMCTKVNADDFQTWHHELGHNYYQRAYNKQDYLYLTGAHDGFHEAIGDMVGLSITPEYLVQIDLLG